MVRLSDAGWSVSQIAPHLGMCEDRVRYWIKRFLAIGFDGLPDQPHVGQTSSLTPAILQAIRSEIEKGDRAWSAVQITEWTFERFGVRLSADWLSRLLKRNRLSYKRTSKSLKHKQNPHEVELKRAELQTLEKGARPG